MVDETIRIRPRGTGGRLALTVVILVSVAAALWAIVALASALDPEARYRAAQADYEAAQQRQRLQWVYDTEAALVALWPLWLLTLAGAGVVIAWKRYGAPESVTASYQVKYAAASRPNVPQSLHYSPNITHAPAAAPALPPALDAGALSAPTIPSFAQLLDGGMLGKDRPLLLAYHAETGEPITGKIGSIYTAAIGGLPESGKSTTARWLASQLALKGCKLVLADPHGLASGDAADDTLASTLAPLHRAFLTEPATDYASALDAIRLVSDELERRKRGREAHEPILIVLDEFSTLMRNEAFSNVAGPLLESLATEGRKFLVYAMLLGQQWQVSRSGGGELRDVLASAFVHRLKMKQASMLTGLTRDEIGYPVDKLLPGQVLLYRTSGELVPARVPLTTAADMRHIAGVLTANHPTMPRLTPAVESTPDGSQMYAGPHVAATAAASATVAPEALRVLELFLSGLETSAIVLELRGVKSSQGATYQRASREINELLRQAMTARR